MQSEMKNSPERKKKAPAATSKFDALGTPKHNTSRVLLFALQLGRNQRDLLRLARAEPCVLGKQRRGRADLSQAHSQIPGITLLRNNGARLYLES